MELSEKITVIVVSLNTKNDFLKTIKSIKKQNYKNIETIVVDGDSIDGTKTEILKDDFIDQFIIEKDNGIYDAMNKGVKISNGDWIIFLNSGDIFFDNDVLKNINNLIEKNIDIIFGNSLIDNSKFIYKHKSNFINNKSIVMPFSHQSVLTSRNLLIHNNFDLNYNISSDFNFFLTQHVRKKKFKKIDLFISITKSGGLSDKKRINVFKENYKILKENNLFYKNSVNFLITFLFLITKKVFKTILPNYIKEMILKIKYKDKIYKK